MFKDENLIVIELGRTLKNLSLILILIKSHSARSSKHLVIINQRSRFNRNKRVHLFACFAYATFSLFEKCLIGLKFSNLHLEINYLWIDTYL